MRYLLLIISCFFVFSLSAESINDLKKKQKKAKQQIELTNKLLNKTKKSKNNTVSNLSLLKKKIKERENLISALNSEILILDKNLSALESQKKMLERRLSSLKKEYAELVYYSYFHQQKDELNQYFFILSASSFSQAYRRMRYVQEYSEYRKKQSIQIQKVANELNDKVEKLINTKISKELVAKGTETENLNLQSDEKNKKKMLKDLSKKEQELRNDLKKQQKDIRSLNNKIDRLIAEEIRKAEERRKAEEEKRKKEGKTGKSTSSKELALIAGGFQKNKGRLPWPVKGIVTGHFGVHPHPVLKHVEVNNKGIYIQTQQGANATAVFKGEVTQVFAIPGNNNAIIVKHGTYRTVYANLTTTYVKIGDKITDKQKLGKVYVDDENDNKTELYFMLYKNSTLDNPEQWLSK